MPDTLLVSLADLKAYLFPEGAPDSSPDEILTDILGSVSEMLVTHTGVTFATPVSATEYYDGKNNASIRLKRSPVASSPLPVVKENGVALVVAVGYSDTADVILKNPGEPMGSWLTRRPGATAVPSGSRVPGLWCPGVQNIEATYSAGYATIPPDIRLVVKYAASFLFAQPDRNRIGVSRRQGKDGSSTDFFEKLPEVYRDILQRYRVPLK